jgi:uncharacterized membrane protein YsdA (DUF1294 family)
MVVMVPIIIKTVWLVMAGWIVLSSLVGFFAIGLDKSRANLGEWRIPERMLLTIAMVGGAFGVAAGCVFFHHKTLKNSFLLVTYAAVIVWLLILLELGVVLGPHAYLVAIRFRATKLPKSDVRIILNYV